MPLFDIHIHIGRFNELHFSPASVQKLMTEVGVDYYAVSSTTICEENYEKVIGEFNELLRIDTDRAFPVMWITPDGLNGNIAWYLESNIEWKMLKVHPELHPCDWKPMSSKFNEVIDIAKELHLPIMIHTGEKECCRAGNYNELISKNKDITFILAHGRPLMDTMDLLSYENVYVDSAFMPIDNMKRIIDKGYSHKLLWGTDMLIPKYFYPKDNMADYYLQKLTSLKECCSKEAYNRVTFYNAAEIFEMKI